MESQMNGHDHTHTKKTDPTDLKIISLSPFTDHTHTSLTPFSLHFLFKKKKKRKKQIHTVIISSHAFL